MKDSKKLFNNNKPEKYNSTQAKKPSLRFISKYQRLYLLAKEDNTNNSNINSQKNKKFKHFSLKHIFEKPKDPFGGEKHWPRVTHPELPFKNRNRISREERKEKLIAEKPSHIIRDFYTIKWLRKKYSDSVIEKSVCTLLPNKKENINISGEKEIEKRHREMLEYLDSFKGPIGREKYVDINPKYLFSETTFQKILKLRDIFMEFDPNQRDSKMAFNEILYKFNQNHIKAEPEDIVNLFFKDKQIKKKEDLKKLYLDFYQFINFALEKDQEFREFMRKIKRKYLREKKLKSKNEFSFDNDKNNNIYLPMNFNLVLDYFINKGKERESIQKVQTAIREMDRAIREKEKYIEKHTKVMGKQSSRYINIKKSNLEKVNELKSRSLSNKKINQHKISKYYDDMTINENINNNKKEKVLTDINVGELFKEVFTLFNLNNKTATNKKTFKDKFGFETSLNKEKNDISEDNKEMIELIKNQINKNTLKKMTMNNFHKYHDLRLTVNITKEQVINLSRNINNLVKGSMSFDKENKNNLKIIYGGFRRLKGNYSRNICLKKKGYMTGRFSSGNQSTGRNNIKKGFISNDMSMSPKIKNVKFDFVPQEFFTAKNS